MPEVFSMEAAVRPVRASRSALVTIWDGRWWPKARRKGIGDSSVEVNPTAHERLCLLEEFGCSEQNTGVLRCAQNDNGTDNGKSKGNYNYNSRSSAYGEG